MQAKDAKVRNGYMTSQKTRSPRPFAKSTHFREIFAGRETIIYIMLMLM